jgi:hypothetical protein
MLTAHTAVLRRSCGFDSMALAESGFIRGY